MHRAEAWRCFGYGYYIEIDQLAYLLLPALLLTASRFIVKRGSPTGEKKERRLFSCNNKVDLGL